MPAWAVTAVLAALIALATAAAPRLGVRTVPRVRDLSEGQMQSRTPQAFSNPTEAVVIRSWIEAREKGDAEGALAACHKNLEFLSPRVNAFGHKEARALFVKAFPSTKIIKPLARGKDGVWTRDFSFSPVPFVKVRIRQSFTVNRDFGGSFKILRVENVNI